VPRTPADKKRLLLAAIKPPIYTVALVPVLVRARAPPSGLHIARCTPRARDSGCEVR
jgi:hypothetical protein